MIYSAHSPFVYAAIIATAIFGGKTALIISDLPMGSWTPRKLVVRLIKPINSYFMLKAIRCMTGVVALTQRILDDYAPGLPSIVVEAIVNSSSEFVDTDGRLPGLSRSTDEKIVLYAGWLQEEYGVKLLLDAFSLIDDDTYRLWIFGRGDLEEQVKAMANRDRRITYWGFVRNEEVMRKELQATVLVNPRPSHQSFTAYSFPSKLIEYMSTGRPVISTALPGIPREYHDYLFILRDESPQGLSKLLEEVCTTDAKELSRFGQRSREFVWKNKNHLHQGKRIYEFLEQL